VFIRCCTATDSAKLTPMKKYWGLFWAFAALIIVVAALAIWAEVDTETVIGAGLGFIRFFWLVVVITVPWNVYFAARQAGHRAEAARRRQVSVHPEYDAEITTLSKRTLTIAIAAHVLSAVIAALVAVLSGYAIGYYAAGFFLGSMVLRPAAAYFAYLRTRIATISHEVAYPPDDVRELRQRLEDVEHELKERREEQRNLREVVARHDRHIVTMKAHFDSTLDRVIDREEIIAGLRAFARLLREAPEA
ncbi:hypothetical protein, partial [Nocardia crassostreae]|uniref:hypothetical protein n=1 Tax=Nocardia crassostreae TaxID=53428 RepID=UPI000ADBBFEE